MCKLHSTGRQLRLATSTGKDSARFSTKHQSRAKYHITRELSH